MPSEYNYSGKAMGTTYHVSIVCDKEDTALSLHNRISASIKHAEQRYSRFLPESELSLLNTYGTSTVSSEFIDILNLAISLCRETSGYFNPLLQIAKHGYTESFEALQPDQKEQDFTINTNISEISIDSSRSTVTLAENQQLDFGGILKGHLAQKLAHQSMQEESSLKGIVINIGGDLATYGTDKDGKKFIFSVYNPISGEEEMSIPLCNSCLATSGSYKRTWRQQQRKVHHILAPNGKSNPGADIISASVIHPDGAHAEAYAKMLFSINQSGVSNFFSSHCIPYVTIDTMGITQTHLL